MAESALLHVLHYLQSQLSIQSSLYLKLNVSDFVKEHLHYEQVVGGIIDHKHLQLFSLLDCLQW